MRRDILDDLDIPLTEKWKMRREWKKQDKQRKKLDKWIAANPEEYERRIAPERERVLAEINESYLSKGYITKPYETWEEMLAHLNDSAHKLTAEEERELLRANNITEQDLEKIRLREEKKGRDRYVRG